MTEELKPIAVRYTVTESGNVIITDNKETLKNALEKIIELEKENERLKQQIDKMKCCGNCKYLKSYTGYTGDTFFCEENNYIVDDMSFCDKWGLVE